MTGAQGAETAPSGVLVSMRTDLGDVVIAVDLEHAPASSADFLAYVDDHAYDGGTFYRTVGEENDHGDPSIEVVQGGVRHGATRRPHVPHEPTTQTGLRHVAGTVSLPRGAVGSASGADFFVCVRDAPSLDAGGRRQKDGQGFAAFGRIVTGMSAIEDIHGRECAAGSATDDAYTRGQRLRTPVVIRRAARLASPVP